MQYTILCKIDSTAAGKAAGYPGRKHPAARHRPVAGASGPGPPTPGPAASWYFVCIYLGGFWTIADVHVRVTAFLSLMLSQI